MTTKHR